MKENKENSQEVIDSIVNLIVMAIGVVFYVAAYYLLAWLNQMVWNSFVPEVTGFKPLTFNQALLFNLMIMLPVSLVAPTASSKKK